MNLKARLAALEAKYQSDREKPIVLFDDSDPQTIGAAKQSGRMLILLSESHGYEVWADGQRVAGEIKPQPLCAAELRGFRSP
jgi:hypothetical protein